MSVSEGFRKVLKASSKDYPIYFETVSGEARVAGRSDYHSIVYTTRTELKDVSVALPVDSAKELVERLEREEGLSIASDGVSLEVNSPKSSTTLSIMKEKVDIPKLLSKFTKGTTQVSGATLKLGIRRVIHASNDTSLGDMVLRGYHLVQKEKELELMASTGLALSIFHIPVLSGGGLGTLLLNPEFGVLAEALGDEDVLIGVSEGVVSLLYEGGDEKVRAMSTLTNGVALPYEKVLSTVKNDNTKEYKFLQEDVKAALKRMRFFFNADTKAKVTLTAKGGNLTLETTNKRGTSKEVIVLSPESSTTPVTLYINGEMLFNFVSSIPPQELSMYVKDNKTPVLINAEDTLEVISLFTPG